MSDKQKDNPDRAAIERVLDKGLGDVELHSSPLLSALQCRIILAKPGEIKLRFEPPTAYVQGNGVISGGITSTMLDFALAFAALTTCAAGESAVSVGLNVSYLAPVFPGPAFVDASLLSSGFRLSQAEARLTDAKGKLLATANSPLMIKRLSTN